MRRQTVRAAVLMGVVAAAAGAVQGAGAATAGEPPHAAHGTARFASVVDQAQRKVYVSTGPSASAIDVYGYDGRLQQTVEHLPGASGLVLSEDGTTLYVALAAADAIVALDTATLTEKDRHPTGAHTCPTRLTRTGTDVWFGYGCDAWTGAIGRLDDASQPAKVTLDQQVPPEELATDPRRFERAPLLATSRPAPGSSTAPILVASQPHISPVNVRVYEVKDGALVPGVREDRGGSNLTDLAVSPGGSTLYTAAGSQDRVDGFATADLSGKGVWHTGQSPTAVAASPDGHHLASGTHTSRGNGASVVLHPLVNGAREIRYRVPRDHRLADRGLSWSADGTALAIVSYDAAHRTAVQVVEPPRGEAAGG
ncbi:hypothetical protein ACGFMM_24520 [Streptomyces sp. NPDC048604]|uniref:hypothetical protein n=1 Tax=Streptomyces sp. NPDC048604 TaxID=3365578 RepID=UPI0037111EA6